MKYNIKSIISVSLIASFFCIIAAKGYYNETFIIKVPRLIERIYGASTDENSYAQSEGLDTVPKNNRKPLYPPDTANRIQLKLPVDIDQNTIYDPISDQYIISDKIGNDYLSAPTGLTFEEYSKARAAQQEKEYFNKLAGISNGKSKNGPTDPMAGYKIDNSIISRLFGGNDIVINPSGSIDVNLGFFSNFTDNPTATENQRRNSGFDFKPTFDFSVQGKVGEKLKLNGAWNTQSQFEFDNIIKIDYDGEAFGEDDIIKKIEAGNVSLPLRSSLISGSQALFGIRADLQFGKLKVSGLISNQKSQRKQVQLQGGGQINQFSMPIDQYDENKHFLLSQYNRSQFDQSLKTLPQINTFFNLTDIEIWVTNDRQETEDVRDIVALADLGEGKRVTTFNPALMDTNLITHPSFDYRYELPNNRANLLYQKFAIDDSINTRPLSKVVSTLQSNYGMQATKDFEKVRARRLRNGTDFTVHPQLGFVSINISLRPDQVLGVAYRYRYNDEIYQVGEFSTDVPVNPSDPNVIFVKLLKATSQKTDLPLWDLMMKNVYSVGAYQTNPLEFRMDVFYEDPGAGQKRFLPETQLKGLPLIGVFNLDRLNITGDPQPDGTFDFVEGVTINSRTGRVMFPVLEPFGKFLRDKIGDTILAKRYIYPQLYRLTQFRAREYPELNRFTLKGSYKSNVSSEISLGAFNIPRGSVRVTAGGTLLIEDQDYRIDYNAGRVTILNDAYLTSGVPVNVSFEDNALFGFQNKSMMGLRADYEVNKNLLVGATFMRLKERPFTQKVNLGDDPLNNKIYGADVNFSKPSEWLTRMVDKLPLIQTKEPSRITLAAEAAIIQPGHSKFINNVGDAGGVAYVDDFEGSTSSYDMRTPTTEWTISSVPQNDRFNNNPLFPEAILSDNLGYGYNRALMNWFRPEINTVQTGDSRDPYTRIININEVFPNRTNLVGGFNSGLFTMDMIYYPNTRGPYNYELPNGSAFSAGLNDDGTLKKPETRWAGIQRAIPNTDFEAQNYEFIEFYMLSPFLDRPENDKNTSSGKIYINLGNISEDVLKDGRNSFENGLPDPADPNPRIVNTSWGKIPGINQFINAFDNNLDIRNAQDVGLDGLNDIAEKQYFSDYLNVINSSSLSTAAKLLINSDPSNDNFVHFREVSGNARLYVKYQKFNGQEGNSKPNTGNSTLTTSSTNYPDKEDINNDNTLNESESYYQYEIPVEFDGVDGIKINQYITDKIVSNRNGGQDIWYRFKIPINQPSKVVGDISDFRSIRFMRMVVKDFTDTTFLRFARFDLVRNQWRKYTRSIPGANSGPVITEPPPSGLTFDLTGVNFEDNSAKLPVNYVLPQGLRLEQAVGAYQNAYQNEQSLNLSFCNLPDNYRLGIFKNTNIDMRYYERLKMFVHAEAKTALDHIPDGDLSVFMRIGSDFTDNFYEYEIPLKMVDFDALNAVKGQIIEYSKLVWDDANKFDFALSLLTKLKEERNAINFTLGDFYTKNDPDKPNNKVSVKGNPNLGYVKGIMIGIKNKEGGVPRCGEVWINELRMTGFNERGGVAALSRLDLQLADLGTLTLSGNYSSLGWGGLDKRVQERAITTNYMYDVSTNLELGKFIPGKTGIRIPFYFQYTTDVKTPEYDPYDLDIKLKDKLRSADDNIKDSLREQAIDYQNIISYSFNNVRKEKTNTSQKPLPWNIENFSVSYGHTKTYRSDPIIARDERNQYRGGLDYNYSLNPLYISPLKKVIKKDKYLKFLTDFHFNPLPNSYSFNTVLDRQRQDRLYRFTIPEYSTYTTRSFIWDRNYRLNWDLTKSLKFDFNATNSSVIDELAIRDNEGQLIPRYSDQSNKDTIWRGIRNFGRTKTYRHNYNLSYNVPTKNFPFLDWVTARAVVSGTYGWNAAALNLDTLGNVIQNSQNRQLNADLNFDRLYNSIPYLKKIEKGAPKSKDKNSRDKAKSSSLEKQGLEPDSKSKDLKIPEPEDKNKGTIDSTGALAKSNAKSNQRSKEDKKDRTPSLAERIIIRPLLLIRKARITYSEDLTSTVPGYEEKTYLLGMDHWDSPGLGYIAGMPPNNKWFDQATNSENPWITRNIFQNQILQKGRNQTMEGRINLEPFNDFKIDLFANKTYSQTQTELFKVKDIGGDYRHMSQREIGTYTISYFTLSTLFDNMNDVFNRFEENRTVISRRLGVGTHLTDPGYAEGYGRIQQDVLVPAFLSAYTNTDPNTQDLDVFNTFPKINWTLNYNGLTKLDLFKKYFNSFTLSHSYKSTLAINSFNTSPNFDPDNLFLVNPITNNYFSRFEMPDISITEGFSPLLRLDVRTKNDILLNVDYKKLRNLSLSFVDNKVDETKSYTLTIGAGYQIHDVKLPFMKEFKKTKKKKTKKEQEKDKQKDKTKTSTILGGQKKGLSQNDLTFKFDLSLQDNNTVSHFIDQDITQVARGATTLRLSPNIEYEYNKNLTLRLFYDYNLTKPKTSQQFKTVIQNGGITFRILLN